jgi:hypothetical protein
MRMKNVTTLLLTANLLNMIGTEEVCQALDLWYSGILSHEETVDRLGGTTGMLSDQEYQVALDYLYQALCA